LKTKAEEQLANQGHKNTRDAAWWCDTHAY
jgi:hypothetical protein